MVLDFRSSLLTVGDHHALWQGPDNPVAPRHRPHHPSLTRPGPMGTKVAESEEARFHHLHRGPSLTLRRLKAESNSSSKGRSGVRPGAAIGTVISCASE